MRESSFQDKALEYLNGLLYCKAENVSGNARQSGRPDINACYRGLMLKIELKTTDDAYQASKKQTLELRRWYNAGAVVGVIYSMTALKQLIHDLSYGQEEIYKVLPEDHGCESWYRIPKRYEL